MDFEGNEPMDLESISTSTLKPPRIVLYGTGGIGKTTWPTMAPAPIFLPVEDGLPKGVKHFPRVTEYNDIIEAIDLLYKGDHDYKTLVIDSATSLEPMVWKRTCEVHGEGSIDTNRKGSEFGFQRGYMYALETWRMILFGLDALREQGMVTVVIAHAESVKVDPPDADPYMRYAPRVHHKAAEVLIEWSDATLFANYKIDTIATEGKKTKHRAIGTGKRILYTEERPAWLAKNRYALPPELELNWQAFAKAI